MKKLTLVIAAAIGMASAAESSVAQTLIKVGTFVPAKSVGVSRVIKPWMRSVQAEIGNKATLKGFWGGTLGKNPFKQYELVKNGVADVTWVLPGYTAGQFPQMGLFELPFMFRDAIEASTVGWKLHERGLYQGLANVHLIGFFASAPNALFMRKPIQGLSDVNNLKIRSAGAIHAKWLELVKASPQTLASTQMNEALNRGTIDGVVQGWTGMRTFKTMPLVRQAYTVPVGVIPFVLLMNKNTWNGLPKEVQAAITKHGGLKMARMGGKAYTDIGTSIRAKAKKDGKPQMTIPSPSQMESYRKQAQPVHDWWIRKTKNGRQVYDAALEELKKLRG